MIKDNENTVEKFSEKSGLINMNVDLRIFKVDEDWGQALGKDFSADGE